jgi:flagellar hook protein FlgE
MASEISTIQSLKAVDAWIDVINANINGGVRTAYKASRLKFGGSNTDVSRVGTATSLPLQFPEPSLTTANTLIDFSQGAITAGTEVTQLAIQGEGFFLLVPPAAFGASGHTGVLSPTLMMYATRDGDFQTNAAGFLIHRGTGLMLATVDVRPNGAVSYSSGIIGIGTRVRLVYNDLERPGNAVGVSGALRLSDFLRNDWNATTLAADGVTPIGPGWFGTETASSLLDVSNGRQQLKFSQWGSTVYELGYRSNTGLSAYGAGFANAGSDDATILSKSLEASNASMTQSVPELSLAQKLFSALTKVLQTKQTNVDGVLNLVR